jgi:Flp pilus assembly pilin Flp
MQVMKKLLQRLYADTSGDDLIEYALLCAFIALASVAAFELFAGRMNAAYQSWDTGQQDRWDLNADIPPPDDGQ